MPGLQLISPDCTDCMILRTAYTFSCVYRLYHGIRVLPAGLALMLAWALL
jgi:hypothetical protein